MIQHKVAEKTGLATKAATESLGMALQQNINRQCQNIESISVSTGDVARPPFQDPWVLQS